MKMYSGIDLSAKEENPTGICIFNDEIEVFTVFTDKDIIAEMKDQKVVAVDAPLTETEKAFRDAEREMMKEFGPMLPINTPGMKKLSERALEIKDELKCEVIETYPRAVEKSLNIDKSDLSLDFSNEHEYDAYLSALTARAFDIGDAIRFGQDSEFIYIPSTETSR